MTCAEISGVGSFLWNLALFTLFEFWAVLGGDTHLLAGTSYVVNTGKSYVGGRGVGFFGIPSLPQTPSLLTNKQAHSYRRLVCMVRKSLKSELLQSFHGAIILLVQCFCGAKLQSWSNLGRENPVFT